MANKTWIRITEIMFEVRMTLQTCLVILIMLKLTSDLNITWFWALSPLWLWLFITISLMVVYFISYLKGEKIAENGEEENGSKGNTGNTLEEGA